MSIKSKHGFTILELLIVLAIIGLFGAIVMPNLQPRLPRYEREEFIARLNAATQLAQQQAISTNTLYRVLFNIKNRAVVVEAEQTVPSAVQKKAEFKKISGARASFTWPIQLDIRQFLINGQDALQAFALRGTGEVWFFVTPQGYAQEVIINIIDKKDTIDGRVRRVGFVLNPFSAQFKIYDSFQK